MGQKVNPIGFRTGIMLGWKSRWYASKKEFSDLLIEDHKIRKYVTEKYKFAGIPQIEIERTRDEVKVVLHAARPGVIIGAGRKWTDKTSCRTWWAGGSTSRSRKSPDRSCRPTWWPRKLPNNCPSGPASAAR
jgi:hypothetical protein